MNLKERAKQYLESHPAQDAIHLTNDGYGFFNPSDANSHSKNLEDRTVSTFNRKDLFEAATGNPSEGQEDTSAADAAAGAEGVDNDEPAVENVAQNNATTYGKAPEEIKAEKAAAAAERKAAKAAQKAAENQA